MKTYTLDDVAVLIDKVNKYDDDIINFRTEKKEQPRSWKEKIVNFIGKKDKK
ncbi:hypothetical protein [Bartonella doshiae]|uniref:hypothetical protein n=1 Tax=Bartonella doshiae TaxID=33044 RepID=UPI001ABB8CCD|nr:hypothetical protein [Bartonella doshiae]